MNLPDFYNRLQADLARHMARFSGDGWFDLWHMHVDWRGEANESPEKRRIELEVLFGLFRDLRQQMAARNDFQVWLVIEAGDASQDAVYLHTPNPNHDNFPNAFAGVAWGIPIPAWIADLLDAEHEIFGESTFQGAQLYWVRGK